MLELATLELRDAYDFAILVEEEAQARYHLLAELLGDDRSGAGAVCRAMFETEGGHRAQLVARRDALFRDAPVAPARPAAARPAPAPAETALECVPFDAGRLPRTAREALEGALATEWRAHAFFKSALPHLGDPATRAFFEQLMEEEVEHAHHVAAQLAALPPEADLPLRIAPAFVARFRALARRQVALAAAAATLFGCAAGLPHDRDERAGGGVTARPAHATAAVPDRGEAERGAMARLAQAEREAHAAVVRRVHAQVATRMRGTPALVKRRVAQAILTESEQARFDPLLVLALIHVESSFDPHAISGAGALGLMQLVEPTLRRELERSGLDDADPADPVTNVRAGVRYLRRLVDAFGGDLDAALMAYNAGPNRIRGHIRRGGVPARFHVYPHRIRREHARLQQAPDPARGITSSA